MYKKGDIVMCVKHYDKEDKDSLIIGKEYQIVNDNYEANDGYPILVFSEVGLKYYKPGNFKRKEELRCNTIDNILK